MSILGHNFKRISFTWEINVVNDSAEQGVKLSSDFLAAAYSESIITRMFYKVLSRAEKRCSILEESVNLTKANCTFNSESYMAAVLTCMHVFVKWSTLTHMAAILFIFKEYLISVIPGLNLYQYRFEPVKWSFTTTGIKINSKIHVAAIITRAKWCKIK